MTEHEIADAADALAGAHRSGESIEALSAAPATIAEAHAIQDRVTALLGEEVGAFKASTPPGEAPARGVIYTRTIRPSPAGMSHADAPQRGVEGEIAFSFLHGLPARQAAYTRDEVAAAVVALPAIEVVSARFRDARTRPKLEQLADRIANGGLVTGAVQPGWRDLDLTRLRVVLLVNDETVLEQEGGHPFGDPFEVAVAFVNMMREAEGVTAGQIVTTGSCTGLRFLAAGDRCRVVFAGLGEAEVVFAA